MVDADLLIPLLIREMANLIVVIAADGARSPLAGIDQLFFVELVERLEDAGVRQRALADLFGMSRSGFQTRVSRARFAANHLLELQNTVIRKKVLSAIPDGQVVSRAQVMIALGLPGDENARRVISVLRDLVDAGVIEERRTGTACAYTRHTTQLARMMATPALVLVTLQHARRALTLSDLVEEGCGTAAEVEVALETLAARQKVEHIDDGWICAEYALRFGEPESWTAALLDHVKACLGSMADKVRSRSHRASPVDTTGGGTYRFELSKNNPRLPEVLALLETYRFELIRLREAIRDHTPDEATQDIEVVFYIGQNTKAKH